MSTSERAAIDTSEPSSIARRSAVPIFVACAALCAVGEGAIAVTSRHNRSAAVWQFAAVVIALALTPVPTIRTAVASLLDRLRSPSPRARRLTTLTIAVVATLYLLFTAHRQGRDLTAKEQDESMYLIQAQMLAHGRLWMPAHPHAEFFESFHVFARPKYAAIYFPGTALVYAAAIRLHIPYWVVSVAIAGAAVGITYRVIAELIDGAAGWLAAILLLSDVIFRHLSTMVMSHTLMLLLGLLMAWAWLRWRRDWSWQMAVAFGWFAGWAAITRPLDALCYAGPIAVAALLDLRALPSWRVRLAIPAVALLAAAPFLALQLSFDKQVTGRWLQTPVTMYLDHYWPQVKIGFGGSADDAYRPPPTPVPEFAAYYEHFILKNFREYRRTGSVKSLLTARLPLLIDTALPSLLLVAFAPLALFALNDRRWAFVLTAPLFLVGYASFMFFRKHYVVVVFPAVYLLVLLGMDVLRRSVRDPAKPLAAAGCALLVVALSATRFSEVNHSIHDQITPTPILHDFNLKVASLPHRPALIFVTYHPELEDTWGQEPVYNTDVPYPDQAPVTRAHDLGPDRDAQLIAYYAKLSPDRWVYRYDHATGDLQSLGPARELTKK